jgi:hypothetical protein
VSVLSQSRDGLLTRVSLCMSGYRHTSTLERVLGDWFEFLGGRPGEVVYVDGGSPLADTRRLVKLVASGLITRLETIAPDSWENHFHRCYIQEYQSGRIATGEVLVFAKPDTLPFRRGHEGWLSADIAKLAEPGVLAITNTHLIDPPSGREGPYLVHDFASLNFAMMTRARFMEAMDYSAAEFVAGHFRGDYPESIVCEEQYRRALVEWCWSRFAREKGMRVLAREESPEWMIFHINKHGRKLLSIRAAMRRGEGITPHLNKPKGLYRPPPTGLKRVGKEIENAVRRLKGG